MAPSRFFDVQSRSLMFALPRFTPQSTSRRPAGGTSFSALAVATLLLGAGLLLPACEKDTPDDFGGDPAYRGELISYEKTDSWTQTQVDSVINELGLTIVAANGLDIYKLLYKTIDALGESQTIASGALMVPTGIAGPFPMSSYQHGTIVRKDDVPSMGSGETLIGVLFSSTGFVTVMPDYLGLGESPGLHPYVHSKSEATASVDMLRASKAVLDEIGVADNDQLFLFGYSQGGHATMALLQEIEARHADEFNITAAAPMSGPYDLVGAQTDMLLSGDPYASPFYLPYIMFAFNSIYDMYPSTTDFLKEPWATTLPPLFNGLYSAWEINPSVPASPIEIVRDDVLDDFINNPENPFRKALEDNTQLAIAPKAPTRMYYCTGDDQVLYRSAINARAAYLDLGVDVPAINGETLTGGAPLDHAGCVEPSLISAQIWFNSLREN